MSSQYRNLAAAASLLGLCVAISGCGGLAGAAPGYDSPEASFDAMKTSLGKGDFGGFADTLTDETQATTSGMLAVMGAMARAASDIAAMAGADAKAKADKELKPINDVLEKHGLDEAAFESLGEGGVFSLMTKGPEEAEAAMSKLAEPIANKREFLVDMLTTMYQVDSENGSPNGLANMANDLSGTLEDLEIDGESASAVIATASSNSTTPIAFRKTATGWKVHFDMAAMQGGGGARPAQNDAPDFDFDSQELQRLGDEVGVGLEELPGELGLGEQPTNEEAESADFELDEEAAQLIE